MPSLGCFTHSWRTAMMSGIVSQPLDLYLFRAVPPSPELVATLYTTRSSRRSQLSALFWLSKTEKIFETLVVMNSLNGCETISTQYTFNPFSGWDRLFTKKEYLSISQLTGSLRHSFLPFRICELPTKRDCWSFLFCLRFKLSKHEKVSISSFVRLIKS